ncbi:MAG: hypothetical protein CM1200mP36_07470 [Gammaproteobacteria bacterium]|nr:MAG: hypothetical protein CM1200mP36_07470 [Gammaproteobacteria bacterium]
MKRTPLSKPGPGWVTRVVGGHHGCSGTRPAEFSGGLAGNEPAKFTRIGSAGIDT